MFYVKVNGQTKTMKRLFKKIYRIFFPKKKNYSLVLDSQNARRLLFFGRMKSLIENIPGDVVECGVGKAKSFQMLSFLFENEERKLWGFDSFAGFPEPSAEDNSPRNPQKGQWKMMKKDEVKNILSRAHVRSGFVDRVELVEGYFEDTLKENEVGKIALLHLDVDLYNSYRVCLEYLYPKVSAGGVVVFDEYKEDYNWPGGTKAIDEFVKTMHLDIAKDEAGGKYYLIKPR